jgi:hypothetical protein
LILFYLIWSPISDLIMHQWSDHKDCAQEKERQRPIKWSFGDLTGTMNGSFRILALSNTVVTNPIKTYF